jgi:hypothetical protein
MPMAILAIDDWLLIFGLGHGYWSLAMVIGYWLCISAIGYGYWLLIFTLKKCGYGYNPFWLLPIFHVYACNPLAIGHFPLIIGVGY